MSKVGVDAVTRNYFVKPRLEYRTLQGVNGPLVILEVRLLATATSAPPLPRLNPAHSLACVPLSLPSPLLLAPMESTHSASVGER